MNFIHGQKHPITKLYWNSKTQKWLKKPVRDSSKGQNLGKSIGKAYTQKLSLIKAKNSDTWKSYAWLPINLTLNDLDVASKKFWFQDDSKFDINRALSFSTLMIIMRSKVTDIQKRKPTYSSGYVNLHSNDLIYFVGSNYKRYIDFFQRAGFISSPFSVKYNEQKDSFCPGRFAKLYKWQPRHLNKKGDPRIYHRVEYTCDRLLLKLYKAKQERKERILRNEFRRELKVNTYKVATCIDVKQFTSWALSNHEEFLDNEELTNAIVKTNSMQAGDLHITPLDPFGERFHSGFTNTKKELRNFVYLNGKPAHEVDLKSSQFFFFACLTLYPDGCNEILSKGMASDMLNEIGSLMKYYYNTYADFREFVDASLNNSIYQLIISKFNGVYDKSEVKSFCFKAFFSRSGQSKTAKAELIKHFPTVVKLCEKINNKSRKIAKKNGIDGKQDDPIYSIPQLLQRLESRILIDKVAFRAAKLVKYPFTTVHDSFLCASEDTPTFKLLIEEVFTELQLPVPIVDIK